MSFDIEVFGTFDIEVYDFNMYVLDCDIEISPKSRFSMPKVDIGWQFWPGCRERERGGPDGPREQRPHHPPA
jgi:hypothetical protein